MNLTPNISTSTYDYYNYHELDRVNFPKSGRVFYGEYFDLNNQYAFRWSDGGFIVGDSIVAEVSLSALYKDTSNFLVNGNGLNFQLTTNGIQSSTYSDFAADAVRSRWAINTNPSEIAISITKLTSKVLVGWTN